MTKVDQVPTEVLDTDLVDALEAGEGVAWSKFLLEEGFEVLAAYRSIRDKPVREMLIRLMQDIAASERAAWTELN